MRVHILYEHGQDPRPFSHSHLRLLRPLTHPAVTNSATPVVGSWGLEYRGEPVDAVIIDRLWRPDVTIDRLESLLELTRRAGARLILALDDDLGALNGEEESRTALEWLLKHADGLLVTTRRLAERLARYGLATAIVPNVLDERLVVPRFGGVRSGNDRPLVVGYMGTRTHTRDLDMVLPAIESVVRRHGEAVRLEVIGVLPVDQADSASAEARGRLDRLAATRFLEPPSAETEYPLFMLWFTGSVHWDVALAPLAWTEFNASKSDVKYLDYAALGAAGIYSQGPAYRDSVIDGETGLLVDNTSEAWESALERLLTQPELRAHLCRQAARDLYGHRTLAVTGARWAAAVAGLATGSAGS